MFKHKIVSHAPVYDLMIENSLLKQLIRVLFHDGDNKLMAMMEAFKELEDPETDETLSIPGLSDNLLFQMLRERFNNLHDLFNEAQTFMRCLEQGDLQKSLVPTSLDDVMKNATKYQLPAIDAQMGTFEMDRDLPIVMGNRFFLTQAIENIVRNAIKYKQQDIPVQLKITCYKITPKQVTIAIQDNGIGLKADQIDRIFDPFYQVNQQVKGSGVGLSITFEVIKFHGGEIRVESSGLNQGTTFYISLSLA